MKIIVLSLTEYKENDVIYDAITEKESVSFKAYRGKDHKSPYLWLNNQLTIADVEFADRRYKHPTLKEAKLINSPLIAEPTLPYLYSITAISEIVQKTLSQEERYILFKDIESAVKALQQQKDHLMVISIFLANAIKYAGGNLEVDRCVLCGNTKDIVAFSFADGGFICRDCFEETMSTNLTPNQMKCIRYIFKSPNYECIDSDKFSVEDKTIVLKALIEYVHDLNGASLVSINQLFE